MKIKKLLLAAVACVCFMITGLFALPKNAGAYAYNARESIITDSASINAAFLEVGANATSVVYVAQPDESAYEYAIESAESDRTFYVWLDGSALCYSYIDSTAINGFLITDAVQLFKGLSKAETIDMSGFSIFNGAVASDISEMFYGCESLVSIDLSDLYIGECEDVFYGCSALTEVVVGVDSTAVYSELKELWGGVCDNSGSVLENEPVVEELETFKKPAAQNPDAIINVAPVANTLTYNGSAQALVTAGSATNGVVVYKLEGGEYSTNVPTGTNAGNYKVYYKVVGDDGYNDTAEVCVDVVVAKANAVLTVEPTANTLVYNGEVQSLVIAGEATNGVVMYKLDSGEYLANIPAATNAGTYRVYYKVVGNENYNDIAEAYVDVTVAQKEIVIDWCESTFTYNAEVQTITATYKDVAGEDVALTVSVSSEFRNAGEYTATASFKFSETNYKLPTEAGKVYNIAKLKVNKPQADETRFVYSGEELTYQISTSNYYVVSGNKQTEAGVYAVGVELVDKNNTEWADLTSADIAFEFVINKKVISSVVDSNGDAVTGVKVESVIGGVHPDAVLVVDEIKTSDVSKISRLENVLRASTDGMYTFTIYGGYDISLMVEDVVCAPNGKIALLLKVPTELLEEEFEIYHIHDSNSNNPDVGALNYSNVDSNGYVMIETDELSDFVFVLSEKADAKVDVPYTWIIVGAVCLGVTIAAYVVLTKKKKSHEEN